MPLIARPDARSLFFAPKRPCSTTNRYRAVGKLAGESPLPKGPLQMRYIQAQASSPNASNTVDNGVRP